MKGDDDYIFGVRTVIEAVKIQRPIHKIMIQKGMDKELFYELKDALANKKYHLQFVPKAKLDRITRKNHQGVIAFISPVEYEKLDALLPALIEAGKNPLILVLDRITDVRNFGAIVRNAECLGAHCIVVPKKGSALIGSDAIKTSSGALLKVPVCTEDNLTETIQFIKNSGCSVVAVTEKGGKDCMLFDFKNPLCLVFGNEETGIDKNILDIADEKVKIPMEGSIDSLNVSVSTGIILYEVSRQRAE